MASSSGSVEWNCQPLCVVDIFAARLTYMGNNCVPLAFKWVTTSATNENYGHAAPHSGPSYTASS